jgi:molybdopterin-containing oxidoreductase family membrane subunit
VIIVTSLHRDFLPSSWSDYAPTLVEIATLIGSFGLFFTCFLLFCRFLPVIAIAEVKGVSGYARRHPTPDDVLRDGERSTHSPAGNGELLTHTSLTREEVVQEGGQA